MQFNKVYTFHIKQLQEIGIADLLNKSSKENELLCDACDRRWPKNKFLPNSTISIHMQEFPTHFIYAAPDTWFGSALEQFELYQQTRIIKHSESVTVKSFGYSEDYLRDAFMESGIIKGKFEIEVECALNTNFSGNWNMKFVDLICNTDNCIYVFEVERRLNYHSIGQVLTYHHIYSSIINKKIQPCIIYADKDDTLIEVCRRYGINLYQFIIDDVKHNNLMRTNSIISGRFAII